jgi:serine phosphatase RsbU (regulator of sigma subunit)
MVLKSILNSPIAKYLLFGICFGLLFPICAWLFELILNNLNFTLNNVKIIHKSNPIIYMIDTAPLFLGIAFLIVGLKQNNTIKLNNTLEEKVLIKTQELQDQTENTQKLYQNLLESISYSQRIQSSLLPDTKSLKKLFKDSLLYYLPRDTVSGDFPFIFQSADCIYIAAVDCTGHGVPGALMSFVGHFTLNEILSVHPNLSPAEALDKLHIKVQKTLRQDAGETKSADGMDIALIKINVNSLCIEYAGANRPLYLIQNNNFLEVKPDRYPIGGINYHNRKPFVNHSYQLKKHDALLFNTDGLSDQFGGNNGKHKFTSKKLREIIESNKLASMQTMKELIETEFESWKGNRKQIDDVLMIGIKL